MLNLFQHLKSKRESETLSTFALHLRSATRKECLHFNKASGFFTQKIFFLVYLVILSPWSEAIGSLKEILSAFGLQNDNSALQNGSGYWTLWY